MTQPGPLIATLCGGVCDHCVPPWQIHDVRLDQPPWSTAGLRGNDRFRCPGCGRAVGWHFQELPGTPFSDAYREP